MTLAENSTRELVERGQALVRSLATKIVRNVPVPVDLEDLVAYGQVGLAEAAREFDPDQGTQFTTFAYYRIRGAIYDGISKMSWTSRARYHRYRCEHLANEALAQAHEEHTSSNSLEDDARWFRGVAEKLAVIHLVSRGEEGRGIRESSLEDPTATPAASVAGREICSRLREIVATLGSAERRLIHTIYFEGRTLQEAADRLGISKSWASRLHAKTLENLARRLRRMGAEDT
jgi:RNA polymerase sigma factor for flagellar operon FliA